MKKGYFINLVAIFACVAMPLIVLNLAGNPEGIGIWEFTYQELTGIGGVFLYGALMFSRYLYGLRDKKDNT